MPRKKENNFYEKLAKEIEQNFTLKDDGNPDNEKQPPICLKCDEKFIPEKLGQHLCKSCRNSNNRLSPLAQGIGWQVR